MYDIIITLSTMDSYGNSRAGSSKGHRSQRRNRTKGAKPRQQLKKDKEFIFLIPSTHNSFIYLIDGEISIGNKNHDKVKDSTLILLTRGKNLKISALSNAKFLLISGKPIGEQIARGGPFVMNTKQEILKAIEDYHSGTFVK